MAGASVRWTALRSLSPRAWRALLGSLSVLLIVASGCGVDDAHYTPPLGQGGSGGSGAGVGSGPGGCTEGATRECHITLGQHGNVLSCYAGTQMCSNGRWGQCTDGAVANYKVPGPDDAWMEVSADPQAAAPTPLGLSDAGPCMNNPCDPTCQVFDEMPLGGGIVSLAPWSVGSLIGLQNQTDGVIKKGIKQPCANAADCQFNEYCDNPASGTCSHHKCAQGGPLVSGCDPCVTSICTASPGCCVTSSCLSHDVCVQGAALSVAPCNDTCVAAVCGAKATCCSSNWDASCVALVATKCAKTCPVWTKSCVDQVHDICGDICENAAPACGHDKCFTGAPLTSGCDPCVTAICASNPACCSGTWDASCAAQVSSICGQTCPFQGVCKPWLPGMIDQMCNLPDLTVGIPCSATTTIPICNVGKVAAPKGIKLVGYAAGTGFSASVANVCNPPAPVRDFGVTPTPIPPGGCIDMIPGPSAVPPSATPVAGDEILINPPGAAHVAECQCQNNWSVAAKSPSLACEPLSCAGAQPGSESERPNMVIFVERSSAISAMNWMAIQTGLNNFFQKNTASVVGLGAALGFFPDTSGGPNCNAGACNMNLCNLRVNFNAGLTAAAGASDPQENALVTAVNAQTVGSIVAPTGAALQAALYDSRNYGSPVTSHQSVVVVFIMASEPSTCTAPGPPPTSLSTAASLASLTSNEFLTNGTKTYVIGIGSGVSLSTINTVAQAGGGKAYPVAADANLANNLRDSLLAIRGDIFSCVFPLPAPGLFDPTNITVGYLPGGGSMQMPLPQASNAAACGASGFYLDNNASPTQVILCPSTCTDVNTYKYSWGTAALPFIKVKVQCAAGISTLVYKDNCPTGTKVQWGYLGWDTTDPTGTSVVWQARTANTAALLPMASYYNLGTAQATPTNTQVCPIGGACAVDLFKKLNGPPDANRSYLELSLTLNQNIAMGLTPTVNNWKMTYSCPPSE